jgi:hypothetical protein
MAFFMDDLRAIEEAEANMIPQAIGVFICTPPHRIRPPIPTPVKVFDFPTAEPIAVHDPLEVLD